MLQDTINSRPARWVTLAFCGAIALLLVAMSGSAMAKDRNHDGIPDRWEKRHNLSLQVNQANRDQDSDDMPNLGEFEGGTDPRDEDSDGDGVPDADENAGEVASFTPGTEADTGTLVINLYSGETLTGEVTEETTIAVLEQAEAEALAHPMGGSQGPAPGAGVGSDDAEVDEDSGEEGGQQGRPQGGNVAQGDCPGAESGSVADLVPGAIIHQVNLDVTANGKEFRRIEVSPPTS